MRKALIVGINHYNHLDVLTGAVNDAINVAAVLEHHENGEKNFVTPKLLLGRNAATPIVKSDLRAAARELFQDSSEIALFYFAGHGHVEDTGGYLCASDSQDGNDGLPLSDVIMWAAQSPAANKVIILDSCHSGAAANQRMAQGIADIKEGMTILTASTEVQLALEKPNGSSGVFTSLLIDALSGAAMNLLGDITPGSVYAHIDQSLGSWGQRPMFKTHVKSFISLRKANPPIALTELRALSTHFPLVGFKFQLDPTYEPERSCMQNSGSAIPAPDPAHTAVFRVLQNYVKVNLVRPVDAPHMWHAAMESKSCALTVLGEHYRNLVANGLI